MKFIFLDVDGVLNNLKSHERRTKSEMLQPDPTCIAALNRILEQTGARIVVTSTWRAHRFNALSRIFESWGIVRAIWSFTPDLSQKRGVLYEGRERGDEIQAWIDTHPQWTIKSFVILDDSDDMKHLKHRMVRTDHRVGLTMADAERAIEMLNA